MVVVTADHKNVDYDLVLEHASIVMDPRNGLKGRTGKALLYPIAGPPRGGPQLVDDDVDPPRSASFG